MTTFQQMQMKLAGRRTGRMALHLVCLCRDRKLRWHARGMVREIKDIVAALRGRLQRAGAWTQQAAQIPATHVAQAIEDTVFLRKQAAQSAHPA